MGYVVNFYGGARWVRASSSIFFIFCEKINKNVKSLYVEIHVGLWFIMLWFMKWDSIYFHVLIFLGFVKRNKRVDIWESRASQSKYTKYNHLGGGSVIKVWNQEVCSLCGLRFEPCGCSYDDHWRLTWSLT
jgi:hypothetical protein